MPTRWHETPEGRFKVSTPELTALDLVQREALIGGIARVREVLYALWDACTAEGFSTALQAIQEVPTAQRLGALLTLDGRDVLAAQVAVWLEGKRLRIISLEGKQASDTSDIETTFKVRLPTELRSSNT